MCVCVCVCVIESVVCVCVCVSLPDFSFILQGGYQQPVHAGVCGVMCAEKKKKRKKWKNEK